MTYQIQSNCLITRHSIENRCDILCALCVLQELEFQQKKKERIHGDKFVDAMGSFVKVAQFSLSELDETWKDMKQKVNSDFLT